MSNKRCGFSELILSCLLLVSLLGSPGHAAAQDTEWAQYRGPNRDGVALSSPSIKPWPEGGQPSEVWKRPIGEGFSASSLAGDRLLTAFMEEGATFVAAFDRATGEEIWRTNIGAAFEEEMGNGPRSTPTIDGDFAYILNSHGSLFCEYMIRPVLSLKRLFFDETGENVRYQYSRDGSQEETMDYLEFIARVTSHIPDKGQVMIYCFARHVGGQ